MSREIIKAIVDLYKEEGEAVLVTLCRTSGSTPRKAGAKMLVYPDGKTIGSVGGGVLECLAIQKAMELLQIKGSPILWEREPADEDMVCGGSGTLFIERIGGKDMSTDKP
jgi:xanthine/CO dehydrogenase XdhC/CoxF family maturation factor